MWAKRSSSISGSALLRNSSAQVFCSRFALAGGTRNSDSNRLPWGTRGRNIVLLSPPVYATATVAYPILYIRWPTSGRGFYGGIKFSQIWSYLKSREEPNIGQYLLRMTVIGPNRRIMCEYDLVLKRLLSRKEALSKYWWRKTVSSLRELQGLPPEQWHPHSAGRLIEWVRGIISRFWHGL